MDNETRDFYLALNDKAYQIIGSPGYESVLPPPQTIKLRPI